MSIMWKLEGMLRLADLRCWRQLMNAYCIAKELDDECQMYALRLAAEMVTHYCCEVEYLTFREYEDVKNFLKSGRELPSFTSEEPENYIDFDFKPDDSAPFIRSYTYRHIVNLDGVTEGQRAMALSALAMVAFELGIITCSHALLVHRAALAVIRKEQSHGSESAPSGCAEPACTICKGSEFTKSGKERGERGAR